MKTKLLFVFITACITSCSNEKLNNETALTILKSEYKNPCKAIHVSRLNKTSRDFEDNLKSLEELQKQGYVEIKSKYISSPLGGGRTDYYVSLTKKAKSEFNAERNKIDVARAEIIDIVGISQSDEGNTAKVRFSYKLEPTILYPIRGYIYAKRENCEFSVKEDEVEFIKYDTGWKMVKPKSEMEKLMEQYQ